MKVISIYNNKGGVGKTTTSKRLAISLMNKGKKVLLIDNDPQGNLSSQFLEVSKDSIEKTTYELLVDEDINIQECINKSKYEGIDIIVSNMKMLYANEKMITKEVEIIKDEEGEVIEQIKTNPSTRLKNKLGDLESQYDYLVIDNPPTMDYLVDNALVVTDEIIIPIVCDDYSIQGIEMLLTKVAKIKQEYNPTLKISGLFLNRYKKSQVHNKIIEDLNEALGIMMKQSIIKDHSIVNEDSFTNNQSKIKSHQVYQQFEKLFEEMGL